MSELVWQSFGDFVTADHKPLEHVVNPWLPKRGIAMVYGWRGAGKTFFMQHVAYAIATGASVLDWQVPIPRRVLHVDGEMDAAELCARYKAIHEAAKHDGNGHPELVGENLYLLTDAQQEFGLPNLSGKAAQEKIEKVLEATGAEVLVLDNLSSLCRDGSEIGDESWQSMQDWLRKLRREDRTVLMVHHAGKGGQQRGTSKREDILNTSISLAEKKGTAARAGLMTLGFEKHRGFPDPGEFDVQIEYDEGGLCALERVSDQTEMMVMLAERGMSQRDIGRKLGVSAGTVNAKLAKHRDQPAELLGKGVQPRWAA